MEGKFLVLKWNISSDAFSFDENKIPEYVVTKTQNVQYFAVPVWCTWIHKAHDLLDKLLLQDAARLKLT